MNATRAARWAVFSWAFFLGLSAFAPAAEIEFAGYLETSEGTRFVLTDLRTKERSSWLGEGSGFGGYVIVGFDRTAEVLRLKRGEEHIDLPLKSAVVRHRSGSALPADGRSKILVDHDGRVVINGEAITDGARLKEAVAALQGQSQPVELRLVHPAHVAPSNVALNQFNQILRLGREARVKMSMKFERLPPTDKR